MKKLPYNALSTVVALRGTSAGWEKMTRETPPGVAT